MWETQQWVSGWDQGRKHWPYWHHTGHFMAERDERILAPLGYFADDKVHVRTELDPDPELK